MRTKILAPVSALALSALFVSSASAQWQTSFVNQTSTRLIAPPSLVVNDNLEKDFEYADFDQDGDIDLVCMRKFPGSIQGGFPDILLMNEGGVLVDRTTEYGTAADTAGSQGMRDRESNRCQQRWMEGPCHRDNDVRLRQHTVGSATRVHESRR